MLRRENLTKTYSIAKLGDLVEFLDHLRVPVTEKDRIPGDYPYYGANGQLGTINNYIFDEPLVLLAEDGGHFGEPYKPIAYKVTGKCWVNNHAHVLRPKESIDIDFLFRQLQFYDVTPFISGTTRAKLNKAQASKIPLILPPIKIQKRIVAILDKADALRQKRQQALALLDEFLRSTFLEMFGDPAKNPKNWELKEFGKIFKLIRYGTGSPPLYIDSGIPFIRATNIKGGTIIENEMKFISEESGREIEKCRVKAGDLIIVRSGINSGDCALINRQYDNTFAGYDLIIDIDYPCGIFYNFLINSNYGKAVLKPLSRRAGQPHLNAEQISTLTFYYPPIELQNHFAKIVEQTEATKAKMQLSLQVMDNQFNALMQRVFKGEL